MTRVPRLRRLLFALLVVMPFLAATPAAATSTAAPSTPTVVGGDPLPYLHHNFFQRVSIVMVNDVSRPIYRTSRSPILRDRREYRVLRYDPVYETKITNIYGERAVTVRVGTRSTPVYATRTVRQIEGWRNTPVWKTREECVDRFRGRCLQYRTVRYIDRYISEPIWRTSTERYVSGYTTEPIYETRVERYVKDTVTIRQQVGTNPVMGWVTVCSLCELEGYKETKVLTGYEQMPAEQLVGPATELMRCRAAGPNGDCGTKGRRFHNGSWWDYVGHSDSYAPRWDGSRGGSGFTDDCPPGQVRTLDGTTCITPESEPVTVCRFNGSVYAVVLTVQASVLPTDRPLLNGSCDEWNKTVATTLPGVESPTTTLPGADSPTTTLPGVVSPTTLPGVVSPTTLPGSETPATTVPRRPVNPS